MAQVREPALHSPLALADHNQLTIVPADEWRKVAAGPGSGGRFGRTSLCAEHASHQVDRVCILDLVRKETALAMCRSDDQGDVTVQPPLGWELSQATRDGLDTLVLRCRNREQWEQLEAALGGQP